MRVDALDADRIRDFLDAATSRWLLSIEVFETIDSTNSYLMRKASVGAVDGQICLAEHQTSGRGRRGRTWTTPRSRSIALSIGHRVDTPHARLGALSLVVGLAGAIALERIGLSQVGLKWPNDLFLRDAKVGGILIEVVPLKRPVEAVIGVGLNVVRTVELEAVETPVASIDDVLGDVDRNRLAALLIAEIHEAACRFAAHGFTVFRDAWNARNVHAGCRVQVSAPRSLVEGIVLGVDEQGQLMLDTGAEVRAINAGEVSLRAPP
jgi:BirA family biotin operon repressor/biotin-[acetyl-CoA-carboxylase] ligase